MKWMVVFSLLCLQFLTYGQEKKYNVVAQTDKEVYQVGETIEIHLGAKKSFRLATNGDCNSSIMEPSILKEEKGEWTEPEMRPQMCCGLPYTQPMRKMVYTKVLDMPGRYKIVIHTDQGLILSNVFEVRKLGVDK